MLKKICTNQQVTKIDGYDHQPRKPIAGRHVFGGRHGVVTYLVDIVDIETLCIGRHSNSDHKLVPAMRGYL